MSNKKKIGNVNPQNKELQIIRNLALKNKISASEVLLRLSDYVNAFVVTEKEDVFVTIEYAGVSKTVNVNSITFSQWLRNQYYLLLKKTLSTAQIREVIETIKAREVMECKSRKKTFYRICQEEDSLYIDLMNQHQQVIRVQPNGWSISNDPPISFERPATSLSIPKPIMNGDVNKLKKYISLNEENYMLVLSFIIGCFMPDGPYPILILQGSQGSGKSTLSKIIKSIVDPSIVMVQSAPRNEKDLFITALNNHLLVFDNLSGVDAELSDALCKMATGGGITTKKLYTDDEAMVITAKRPQILNGIDYLATRNDLADRAIIITLQKMSSEKRKDEKSFWKEFNNDLPDIVGGICNILSKILANYPSTTLPRNSRMADFVKWISAAEDVLGLKNNEFYLIYENNKNEAAIDAIEQDVLAYGIFELLQEQPEIVGTSTVIIRQLRTKLNSLGVFLKENWISLNKLKDSILRIEPMLNRVGIHYEYKRGKERIHRLFRVTD